MNTQKSDEEMVEEIRQYILEAFDLLQKKYRTRIVYATLTSEESRLWEELTEIGDDILSKHKHIITTIRQAQHKLLLEMLEGMKLDLSRGGNQYGNGYNAALEDIKNKINEIYE